MAVIFPNTKKITVQLNIIKVLAFGDFGLRCYFCSAKFHTVIVSDEPQYRLGYISGIFLCPYISLILGCCSLTSVLAHQSENLVEFGDFMGNNSPLCCKTPTPQVNGNINHPAAQIAPS